MSDKGYVNAPNPTASEEGKINDDCGKRGRKLTLQMQPPAGQAGRPAGMSYEVKRLNGVLLKEGLDYNDRTRDIGSALVSNANDDEVFGCDSIYIRLQMEIINVGFEGPEDESTWYEIARAVPAAMV